MATDSRIPGALWGALIGDAMGVPVEFTSRSARDADPVVDMRAFGTHLQPQGTWSDDSSLLVTTLESLMLKRKFDLEDISGRFQRWLYEAEWTPHGEVFDVGITTREAIGRLREGMPPTEAGPSDEYSNGNGSLMRILPLALAMAKSPPKDLIEAAIDLSSLTHGHPRSQACCAWFCLLMANLVNDKSLARADDSLEEAIYAAWKDFDAHAPASLIEESSHFRKFERLSDVRILAREDVRGSGYVVDCLVASLWCVATSREFEEAVPKAVNLGEDTDTTACVTGALAGALWGVDPIPGRWHRCLARHEELGDLFFKAAYQLPL